MNSNVRKAAICPCCGTNNVRVYDCGLPSEPCWTVECLGYGCGLNISGFWDETSAIDAWNRRINDPKKEIKRWEVLYTTHDSVTPLLYIAEADNIASASFAARNYAASIGQDWHIKAIAPLGGYKMTPEERAILLDYASEQRQDGPRRSLCPRCGKTTRNKPMAKSHSFNIDICFRCASNEILRVYTGEELPVREWAAVRLKMAPAPLKTAKNGKNG